MSELLLEIIPEVQLVVKDNGEDRITQEIK